MSQLYKVEWPSPKSCDKSEHSKERLTEGTLRVGQEKPQTSGKQLSLVSQGRYAGQLLAGEELECGAAARRDVGDAVGYSCL